MIETSDPTHQTTGNIKCHQCGAKLQFKPGTTSLSCTYCGAANEIAGAQTKVAIEELDFEAHLSNASRQPETQEIITVKCKACGAATTLKPNVVSARCPFCDLALVVTSQSSQRLIKPRYVLPFKIDQKAVAELFKKWLSKLWFAPSALKKHSGSTDKINGVYLPYWTFDAATNSRYSGQRGTNYQTTESYTETVNGQTVQKTRSVTRIRWTPVSGQVAQNFDDVLALASRSLPEPMTRKLEPWDLHDVAAFNENFLTGFQTETYQVDAKEGFILAKSRMDEAIRESICRDIGGDHQRVDHVDSRYNNITFKHILLPIWISAYRYHGKVYRFLVNGRTGEVQGERPWSWLKITALVLVILLVLGFFFLMDQ